MPQKTPRIGRAKTIEEVGPIDKDKVDELNYCEYRHVGQAKLHDIVGQFLHENLHQIYSDPLGLGCVVSNNQGSFLIRNTDTFSVERNEAHLYSPSGSLSRFVRWSTIKGTINWYEPAPQGTNVLELYRPSIFDKGYEIIVHKNFKSWGKLNSKYRDVTWAPDGDKINLRDRTKLTYKDNKKFTSSKHAYSQNGRYLLTLSSEGLQLIDLIDYERTMVYGRENGIKPLNFAVSNDGRFVALNNARNELKLIDTSGCDQKQAFPQWERVIGPKIPKHEYSGCRTIHDFKQDMDDAGWLTSTSMIKRLYFSSSGSELFFSLRIDSYTPENPIHQYSWKEYKAIALDFIPSATGYLAMGDSYTSGEGDTEGGKWYEPGTDEQGNKDTFAGRNLCHLSRRSYPYLIALELGYLETNTSTPPSDGLFHSVACSGAKIHNIIGGSSGEKHNAGNQAEFEGTDNQYRLNDENIWHSGVTAQVNSLNGKVLKSGRSRNFDPEIITLGIGGNDAGFGSFLEACVLPGTCEHVNHESQKSTRTVVDIASLKNRLVNTYQKVKEEAPDARVYVHGYPVFVLGGGGNCANNVRLDAKEREFAAAAIIYLNKIVKAAAEEAGVFYVDVGNILDGGRLCDEGEKYVNGATKGNDNNLFIFNVIGNESYHPTPKGFEKYKTALLEQTDNFEQPMPVAKSNVPIPTPFSPVFSEEARQQVARMNNKDATLPEVSISKEGLISRTEKSEVYNIRYGGLYPNSEVEIVVHSTPQSLGNYRVDNNGNLNINTELPYLEPGYHELHLHGFDGHGEQFNVYQSFVVGHSADDFDGDGVSNELDSCPTLFDVGVDEDKDGIDDGCDGVINRVTPASSGSSTPSLLNSLTKSIAKQIRRLEEPLILLSSNSSYTVPAQHDLQQQTEDNEDVKDGDTLGATAHSSVGGGAQGSDKIGVQWWLIAAGISVIGSISLLVRKVAHAKTN